MRAEIEAVDPGALQAATDAVAAAVAEEFGDGPFEVSLLIGAEAFRRGQPPARRSASAYVQLSHPRRLKERCLNDDSATECSGAVSVLRAQ